jgi:hypothetical protein
MIKKRVTINDDGDKSTIFVRPRLFTFFNFQIFISLIEVIGALCFSIWLFRDSVSEIPPNQYPIVFSILLLFFVTILFLGLLNLHIFSRKQIIDVFPNEIVIATKSLIWKRTNKFSASQIECVSLLFPSEQKVFGTLWLGLNNKYKRFAPDINNDEAVEILNCIDAKIELIKDKYEVESENISSCKIEINNRNIYDKISIVQTKPFQKNYFHLSMLGVVFIVLVILGFYLRSFFETDIMEFFILLLISAPLFLFFLYQFFHFLVLFIGKEIITISQDKIIVRNEIKGIGKNKVYETAKIESVLLCPEKFTDFDKGFIWIKHGKKYHSFGKGIDPDQAIKILDVVREHIPMKDEDVLLIK